MICPECLSADLKWLEPGDGTPGFWKCLKCGEVWESEEEINEWLQVRQSFMKPKLGELHDGS
jgi:hypothetical protein